MTQTELKKWITNHLGDGQWLKFAALISEVRESKGLKPLSNKSIASWLYESDRNPPAYVESYLPIILARLANPEPTTIYTIHLALTKADVKALKRTAKAACSTPEEFLHLCARIGFEDQCKIED